MFPEIWGVKWMPLLLATLQGYLRSLVELGGGTSLLPKAFSDM